PNTSMDTAIEPERSEAEAAPVRVRNAALWVIVTLLSILFLKLAQSVFVPVLIGVLLAYALEPLVGGLRRLRIPRVVAATLVMFALAAGSATALWCLRDQAGAFLDELPESARKLRTLVETHRREGEPGPIDSIQQAATEIEKTATAAAGGEEAPKGVTRVQLVAPTIRFR